MRRVLVYDSSKCAGCLYCEVVCTFRHKGAFGRSGSRINIVTNERGLLFAAAFCRHCKKPVCAELCPVDAITRSEETGLVSIDSETCIGCGLCLQCPLGGIDMDDETGLPINCDLCNGNPACVEFCPVGALQYVSAGEARRAKITSA